MYKMSAGKKSIMKNPVTRSEFYEAVRRLVVELMIEVITGVIAKLVSGGWPGVQTEIAA